MSEKRTNMKVYLGDSVYAGNDGFHVIICTNNGIRDENVVYLDGSVLQELVNYATRIGFRVTVPKTEEES